MNKIRKGSIVWDTQTKRQTKVLTSPSKGELPDRLVEVTQELYSERMKELGIVLVAWSEGIMTHNNKPCHLARVKRLIPLKTYLKSLN